jgi:hypothetical protein
MVRGRRRRDPPTSPPWSHPEVIVSANALATARARSGRSLRFPFNCARERAGLRQWLGVLGS